MYCYVLRHTLTSYKPFKFFEISKVKLANSTEFPSTFACHHHLISLFKKQALSYHRLTTNSASQLISKVSKVLILIVFFFISGWDISVLSSLIGAVATKPLQFFVN